MRTPLFLFLLALSAAAAEARKPNIVLIVADDLGYADVGFHGCEEIPTPQIDSIAERGVVFTNGYVSCPVCSPTRAGLLTGRYQQRFGHEYNTGGIREDRSDVGLPTTETTLADVLKKAGYATGAVGKWHLGREEKFRPPERGFDEFFGFLAGGRSYFPSARRGRKPDPIRRGGKEVEEEEYLTDAFGREAEAFVRRHAGEPFFLYLPFNAVHTPMHATDKYLERFPKIEDRRRRIYSAMLSAMDDAIGRVLKALRELKLEEHTLVCFIGDNGGSSMNGSSNLPLRGWKGQMYEGGIRVPFVMQWTGKLPAGRTFHRPVLSLDLFATAAAAAGAAPSPGVDGVDLIPHLLGRKMEPPHEALFWRMGSRFAVRHGDWKLVAQKRGTLELFHLGRDRLEEKDLAEAEAERVAELRRLYTAWDEKNLPPKWPPPVRRRQRRR